MGIPGCVRLRKRDNSTLLARFHLLVQRIIDVVRESDNQQVEVSWGGQGPLCIIKQIGEGRKALPSEVLPLGGAVFSMTYLRLGVIVLFTSERTLDVAF